MKVSAISPSDNDISPYGKLIKIPGFTDTTFSADHFNYWKQQGIMEIEGPIEIGVLQVKKHSIPIEQMERHDHTPELLIPLNGDFIMSVASKTGESPESKDLKAFRVNRGEAILLNKSCWHWMPCPVEDEITILVIFKDNTSAEDLIIKDLDQSCSIIDNE